MKIIIHTFFLFFCLMTSLAFAKTYIIEDTIKDEIFFIDGEKFYAQSWCLNMKEGDEIKFLTPHPFEKCVYAEFLNLRNNQTCKVWCKHQP